MFNLILNIIIKVYSSASSLIPEIAAINDHDNVSITLTFPSGTIACIDLSRFACYGYDQRLEVFGAKGMLQAKNEFPEGTGIMSLSNLLSIFIHNLLQFNTLRTEQVKFQFFTLFPLGILMVTKMS